tara:strand:- start:34 stop:447 length:414 start_codon:yes stop_codon:yes gene_type:complete
MKISEIIEFWKSSNINLNRGAKLNDINNLEDYLNFEFPETFRQFYSNINGFEDFVYNENMFSIFSLERIKEEYTFSDNKNFIPFCDYLINSHQIGFYRNTKAVYTNYENILGDLNDKVADNFELSMIEILTNSAKIY